MTTLIHGGDIYSAIEKLGKPSIELLDFSANINPLGLPPSVEQAVIDSLTLCTHYPDPLCRELVKKISQSEEVHPSHILCGNGAADLIYRYVQVLCPKNTLLLAPTFSEYELALETVGGNVIYYPLSAAYDFKIQEDYLDYLTSDLEMIILCNPNNPTGELIDSELLQKIVTRCEALGIHCFIDECFNDFLDEPANHTLIKQLTQYKYLVILKAFTKIYAMPGIRLGYILTQQIDLLERIRHMGQCWSVSVVAQQAGLAALDEANYLKNTKELIGEERKYLTHSLECLQMHVYGSHANYVFFSSPHTLHLDLILYEEGILIRSCSNFHGLDHTYYRIAIRTHQENIMLIQAIERILHNGKTTYDSRNNI